jgi:hypothetical protein
LAELWKGLGCGKLNGLVAVGAINLAQETRVVVTATVTAPVIFRVNGRESNELVGPVDIVKVLGSGQGFGFGRILGQFRAQIPQILINFLVYPEQGLLRHARPPCFCLLANSGHFLPRYQASIAQNRGFVNPTFPTFSDEKTAPIGTVFHRNFSILFPP